MPENKPPSSLLRHDASPQWDYVPRRDVAIPSTTLPRAPPNPNRQYIIIHREPGSGRELVPHYILRERTKSNRDADYEYIRVNLYDIEDYVSLYQVEEYEHFRFESGAPEFESRRAWLREIRRRRRANEPIAPLLPPCPNVNVRIVQKRKRSTTECSNGEETDDPTTSENESIHFSPPAQRRESTTSQTATRDQEEEDGEDGEDDGEEGENNQAHPDDDDVDNDDENENDTPPEYEISHVLDQKNVLGTHYFLVAWNGHPDSSATWLTASDLDEMGIDEPASLLLS